MGIKAAFKALFAKDNAVTISKTREKAENAHDFDDNDRLFSSQIRAMRQDAKRLEMEMQLLQQKRRLEELKAEIIEDDFDDSETEGDLGSIMALLAPILLQLKNNQGGQSAPISNTPPTENTINPTPPNTLTDDDIREMLAKTDRKYIEIAKKAPKKLALNYAINKMGLSELDAEKAYKILIEEF